MGIKRPLQRYRKLWSKFRQDPLRYFQDSKLRILRTVGVPLVRAFPPYSAVQILSVYDRRPGDRKEAQGMAHDIACIHTAAASGSLSSSSTAAGLGRFIATVARGFGRLVESLSRLLFPRRIRLDTLPLGNVERAGTGFQSGNGNPQFMLGDGDIALRPGWVILSCRLVMHEGTANPTLYFNFGAGINELDRISLPPPADAMCHALLRIPLHVHSLVMEPMEEPGTFELSEVTIQEVSSFEAARFLCLNHHVPVGRATEEVLSRSRLEPHRDLKSAESYSAWVKQHDTLTAEDISAIRRHIETLAHKPRISVVTPVYDTLIPHLQEMLHSLAGQLYEDWELCVVDDGSPNPQVRGELEQAAARDARIKPVFRPINGGITAATNDGLSQASGDWIVFLDHDDTLSPSALYMIAVYADAHADAVLMYSDSDAIDNSGRRYNPFFKPDWNYDLLLGMNYLNHLCAYRRTFLDEVGGLPTGFDGSQDYALNLLAAERLQAGQIIHIPFVLYHWRYASYSVSYNRVQRCTDAARRAISEHLQRRKENAHVIANPYRANYHRVERTMTSEPAVSIIIPTRDRVSLLSKCVKGVLDQTHYTNLQINIIDNDSREPETLRYFDEISRNERVRVLPCPGPFNFSRIMNFAVAHTDTEVLLLLNNDIAVFNPDWLSEMVSHITRPGIGAVGAKLIYSNGTIQHAGVVLGIQGVAGHVQKHRGRREAGQNARLILTQEISAVTAACMATRRSVYDEVRGFDDEHLTIAFNDIDYCLKVREKGYRIIWTPFAELYHLESASRGYEDTPEKRARFGEEIQYMQRRWGNQLLYDPYYNPNLTLRSEDCQLAATPRVSPPWRKFSGARTGSEQTPSKQVV